MKVKQLIEELKKFDGELEVKYNYVGAPPIDEVTIQNEYYKNDRKKVVVLY